LLPFCNFLDEIVKNNDVVFGGLLRRVEIVSSRLHGFGPFNARHGFKHCKESRAFEMMTTRDDQDSKRMVFCCSSANAAKERPGQQKQHETNRLYRVEAGKQGIEHRRNVD